MDVFQAEGVTLALEFFEYRSEIQLTGELLAVEPDAYVLDAYQGRSRTVVRVPLTRIAGGSVYTRSTRGPAGIDELAGFNRVGQLGTYGRARNGLDLRLLSRFPDGLSGRVLTALLQQREQATITPYEELLSDPR